MNTSIADQAVSISSFNIDFFNEKLLKRILVHLSERLFEGSLVTKWKRAKVIWTEFLIGCDLSNIHNLNARSKSLPFSTLRRRVRIFLEKSTNKK